MLVKVPTSVLLITETTIYKKFKCDIITAVLLNDDLLLGCYGNNTF